MIIYLHGFSSSAASDKAQRIKILLRQYQIYIADYPSHQPANAIKRLKSCITEISDGDVPVMLIGSSLGGFYAQYLGAYLSNVHKVVLINPALQPQLTLKPYLGMHMNMVSGELFNFLQSEYDQLALYDVTNMNSIADTLVLLDKGDSIIDYRVAEARYRARGRVVCYPGGSHWFEHLEQAVPEIVEFYCQ